MTALLLQTGWPLAAAALAVLIGGGCRGEPLQQNGGSSDMPSIERVQARHEDAIMAVPGVVGMGIGEKDGAPAFHVYVGARTPEVEAQVPDSLGPYPVVIIESGEIRAQ